MPKGQLKKQKINLSLSPDVLAYLRERAEKEFKSMSQVMDDLMRKEIKK